MAASEATAPFSLGPRAERPSPAPAAQSKRDRKRQAVIERLAMLSNKFSEDKDSTYRDQLQKIQIELNHLQKFDPYADDALDVAARIQNEYSQSAAAPTNAEAGRSLVDMAGIQLPQFMSNIQDLWEIRDFSLTQSKNEYERKVQEFHNTYTFKMETAKREHSALNSTMRDRLINQLTNKKNRLVKEKEAFEISETNALLLHPSQFSLANPGSPGGHPGKRTTRNRKEADDFSEGKKRKRNGGEDDGSPAPSRRALDPANTTPFWQSEKVRNEAKKRGADYSIGSLFTDKELSMHYNTAALAAHKSMVRHRVTGSDSSPEDSDSGDGEQASSVAMERQVSHATRSTRGNANNQNFFDDKMMGIEGIANYELPANLDLMHSQVDPKIPVGQPSYYLKTSVKASSENSAIPQTRDEDFKSDMQVIAALKQYDQTRKPGSHLDNPKGPRKTFEVVAMPYRSSKYVGIAGIARDASDVEVYGEALEEAAPPTSDSREALHEPSASRQSSVGAVAMSRQGTAGSGRSKPRKT